jgi:hypothetical protein
VEVWVLCTIKKGEKGWAMPNITRAKAEAKSFESGGNAWFYQQAGVDTTTAYQLEKRDKALYNAAKQQKQHTPSNSSPEDAATGILGLLFIGFFVPTVWWILVVWNEVDVDQNIFLAIKDTCIKRPELTWTMLGTWAFAYMIYKFEWFRILVGWTLLIGIVGSIFMFLHNASKDDGKPKPPQQSQIERARKARLKSCGLEGAALCPPDAVERER